MSAFGAALTKDLRLLARDRVGLVFLTLAPIVVITVAGLSLAALYGGASAPVVPLVDEDGGWVGRGVRERLASEGAIRVRQVATRDAARALVVGKSAGAALVVPSGTSDAIADGRTARLVVLSDPVRTVDVTTVRAVVQEVRHGLETAARERANDELAAARERTEAARSALEHSGADLRQQLDALTDRLDAARREAARRRTSLRAALAANAARRVAAARARLVDALTPLRGFLQELTTKRAAFDAWMADVRKQAGRFADRVPPPPEPPVVPPAVAELTRTDPETLATRIIGGDAGPPDLPPLPDVDAAIPRLPALDVPSLPTLPSAPLPGTLDVEETSVTGAPARFNTFDQNVPGFSVTFLLLGVLLGVSLGLLDERDWGTLERVRATPLSLPVLLGAKLAARFTVGIVQMVLLFVVGWLAFDVSLGPAPWALLLPTTGIVFAGTAFGLVVAGLTPSREAVLPIGSIAILTMAAVGGCWWPIDLEPDWMRRLALAFPTTWAMEAYNDLMIRRWGAGAVVGATAVLVAYGLLYLMIGLALFRRRVSR